MKEINFKKILIVGSGIQFFLETLLMIRAAVKTPLESDQSDLDPSVILIGMGSKDRALG